MLLLLRLERFHRCEKVFSFRLKSRSEARRDLLDNHSVAEAFPQLLLDNRALSKHKAFIEVWLVAKALGYLFKCGVDGDVRVRNKQDRSVFAIVRLNNTSERFRLTGARRPPDERCVAPKRTPHRADLLPIEIIPAREH